MPFDETWAFVREKPKNCDPDDANCGDCWDHVALDPETRLVVSLVVGKRTADATHALVADFRRRTGGRVMRLMTSDEYPACEEAPLLAKKWNPTGFTNRPLALPPAWRTSAVIALAREMYESRDFSAMPILADALQDAGCDNDDVLSHCRGPGPHVRGCWVVDLVLGKR